MSSGMICVPQWTCYINSHVFGAVKSKDSCMCLLTENLKKMSLIDEDKSHNIMAPDEENPLVLPDLSYCLVPTTRDIRGLLVVGPLYCFAHQMNHRPCLESYRTFLNVVLTTRQMKTVGNRCAL